MWQNLSTDDQHTIVPHLVPYRRYIEASSVKRVHLGEFAEDCWPSVANFVLAELKCDAIQNVDVRTERLARYIVIPLLVSCGNTLTHIYFAPPRGETMLERWETDVTPDIFIQKCPNLTSFTFVFSISFKFIRDWAPTLPSSIKNSHLTELTLGVDREFNLEPFLQTAPNLEQLALLFPDIRMLTGPVLFSLLDQHCPRLTSLALTSNAPQLGDLDITELHMPRRSDLQRRRRRRSSHQKSIDNRLAATTSGDLTDLLLHDSVGFFRQTAVFLLHHFVRHQHSVLERLDLSGNTFSEHRAMAEVCRYEFPLLTHLTVRYSKTDAMDLMHQLITPRCVPNLRSLHIRECLYTFTDAMLLNLPNTVDELILEDCCVVTQEGLVRFLESRRSTLRKIGFRRLVQAIEPHVLHHVIASLHNVIDELIIERLTGIIIRLVPDMITFFDIMLDVGKQMRKIQLSFDDFYDSPDFLETVQGKAFLDKLDRVANEWIFHFKGWVTITHEEYRRRKRTK
ncbi:hypothetical protein BDB00DRAFT_942124 [Zychaea mexicana]|uniref:uncharacterized protein n=1 Tax=Zychaea mexicana TaxID=64656 RepID=UPI0022FEDDA8|nr:uncharacterized protein BDB00DRAFT_942124 [Zychaea mexicana]KAI9488700.1 hypothetical protein BDB00DRAFT_942124 [Zychaea mexicana]